MIELPDSVLPLFVAAGWYPGRRTPVSSTVPIGHPAVAILAEFGGLAVEPRGINGEECAPSNLEFQELDPDDSIERVWADLLGTQLIGIADLHRRHGELYVAADGRCFGLSCVHDAFWFQGGSFAEAVEWALLGRRPPPLLRPDQSSVTLFGNRFTAESPGLYRYRW